MRKAAFVLLLIAVLVLAGCNNDKKDSKTEGGVTETPFVPTPLPPTWTATPPGFVASPTFTATPAGAATDRPGSTPLPPTWTPGRQPTVTPIYTPTAVPPTLGPAATWTPLPDYCSELQISSEDSRIRTGTSVAVSWTPISGYNTYQLNVYNPSGQLAFQATVTGNSFTLPGSIFVNAGGYGWEVWPLNAQGERICYPAGRDIIVDF